jgi:hypothetical protein
LLLSFIRCQGYNPEANAFHSGGAVTLAGRQGAIASYKNNLFYSGCNRVEQVYVGDNYGRSTPAALDSNVPLS